MYNSTGTKVVTFTYDAFGRCTVSGDTTLAEYCRIRYRGYYYDTRTGLYWVQTRYYNPDWCRWISPDSVSYLDSESPHGLNLYLYCGNDPINYVDPSGHSWESFWQDVGDWFKEHWVEVAVGTAFIIAGAIVTAATAGAGTPFVAAFGSALLSSTIHVTASVAAGVIVNGIFNELNGNEFLDNVGDTIASSYMWGGIFAGGSQILSGGFRNAANQGLPTGRKSGYYLWNSGVKILSPDKNNWIGAGGTLFSLGYEFRIDVSPIWGLHAHILDSTHIPIGFIIAAILSLII